MRAYQNWVSGALLLLLLIGCTNSSNDSIATPLPADVNYTGEHVQEQERQPSPLIETGIDESLSSDKLVFEQLENVFGFADESGERLITINEDGVILENPEQFHIAIGNNGEWVDIEFVGWQDENDQNNNRLTMHNFNNLAGNVYKATKGKFVQNKSYWLVRDGVGSRELFAALQSTIDPQSSSQQYLSAPAEMIAAIEVIKGRKILSSRLLSETSKEKIVLFVFEREAEHMLASLAYIQDDKVLFKDFPATYNESGTWRVENGDDPGVFEVLFLAQSDEGLIVGISWGAAEGENLFILKELHGGLQETDLRTGRYWSPQ